MERRYFILLHLFLIEKRLGGDKIFAAWILLKDPQVLMNRFFMKIYDANL